MLIPWWERWPERLDLELGALDTADIPYRRDDDAFKRQILVLHLRPTVEGETVYVVAVFPDTYPYTRFELFAPELDLAHHQNPFAKNLCVIGRGSENWSVKDTLAKFIQERLPLVLKAGRSTDVGEASPIEEHQAEPFSDYYPYAEDGALLVDSSWRLNPEARGGELIVGLAGPAERVLRGAVLEIRDSNGATLAQADPAIARQYPSSRRIRGRWLRVPEPTREKEPGRFIARLAERQPELGRPRWENATDIRIDLLGVAFPEELAWRQTGDGWVFVARAEKMTRKGSKRLDPYFLRAVRAGRVDLGRRIPELIALQERSVAVFGLGCLGAPSALEFARSGVGSLWLIDCDTVEAGTVVRWPLGLGWTGVNKARALKAFIDAEYPYTKALARAHCVGASPSGERRDLVILDEILGNANLVYDATAELGIEHLLADRAADRGIPYICVSATPGAWGGLVLRVRPGSSGCWLCLQHLLMDGRIPTPPLADGGTVQPEGCAAPTFTGAGFDISQIALAGVRLAVATLCSGTPGGYPDFEWDVAVATLRDEAGKPVPIHWDTFPLAAHPECPACSRR